MIWKRYLFKEFFKVFFLMIFCCYFLFVLIDYSAHTKTFHQPGIHFLDILIYYLFQFTKRAEMLITASTLIASIKVLTTLNVHGEITALVTNGLSLRRLLSPLLFATFLVTLFLYANFQWFQPMATTKLDAFESSYFKQSHNQAAHCVQLPDDSLLLYQHFEPTKQTLHDVYWVKDQDHLYHIKLLEPYLYRPIGHYVDQLERNTAGEMKQVASHALLPMPGLHFETKMLSQTFLPPMSQPLSELMKMTKLGITKTRDREAAITTCFYYKATIPLAVFFALLAIAPYCLRFGRHLPVYFIYAFALFGLIGYFTFVNASVILGQSQVIAPFWALCLPPTLCGFFCIWNYVKL